MFDRIGPWPSKRVVLILTQLIGTNKQGNSPNTRRVERKADRMGKKCVDILAGLQSQDRESHLDCT